MSYGNGRVGATTAVTTDAPGRDKVLGLLRETQLGREGYPAGGGGFGGGPGGGGWNGERAPENLRGPSQLRVRRLQSLLELERRADLRVVQRGDGRAEAGTRSLR